MKASELRPGQFPQGTEARVCQDIAERQAMGTAKYGTTVERNPLSLLEWLEHAYQECLDQAVYLKRAMEELQTGKNVTGWDDEPQSESDGIALIATERQRQISKEGWSSEHDDSVNRRLRELLQTIYDGIHRGIGPMASASDSEIASQINDVMCNVFGNEWKAAIGEGGVMTGKWSISTNEENYNGVFDTEEDAIAEGKASEYGRFWVGKCVTPIQPEAMFQESAIEDWLEHHVWGHDDYSGEWAEGHVSPTPEQMDELASQIRPFIAAWLDRHSLRPKFWNIDPFSVRQIDSEREAAQ